MAAYAIRQMAYDECHGGGLASVQLLTKTSKASTSEVFKHTNIAIIATSILYVCMCQTACRSFLHRANRQ